MDIATVHAVGSGLKRAEARGPLGITSTTCKSHQPKPEPVTPAPYATALRRWSLDLSPHSVCSPTVDRLSINPDLGEYAGA
jgi:hypothetical protein